MANRILFCATVDYHFKAFHMPYMKWFKEQGWRVDVAASGDINLPYTDNKYDIPIQRSPFSRSNISAYKQLKAIINENKYAIIHCHTPLGGVLGRLAARQARKQGSRVIYTAHGFHFCKGVSPINWAVYYPIEKVLARYTDWLITINKEDYSLVTKRKFKAGSIAHVHGIGIDTEQFKPVDGQAKIERRESFGYQSDDFLLCYAGEFNKNKNQQFLLEVMALLKGKIPNGRLLLAGEGEMQGHCRELADHLGISHIVDFLGFRKDIKEIMSICDVAVAASYREGLPVNVMEAMACALPVVATDNRGHRELVHDDENGYLIEGRDQAEFAEKVELLAERKDVRTRQGLKGREMIVETYSSGNVLAEKVEIYQACVGLHARGSELHVHGAGLHAQGPELHVQEAELHARGVELHAQEAEPLARQSTSPLRVLHVAVNMNRGGAETLMMNLYRNINRSKVQFDFLTCKAGVFDAEIQKMGGRMHRIPYVTEVGHYGFIRALKHFLQQHPEYHIIHSHMDKMSGFVLKAAKEESVPVRIAHSHNTESEGGLGSRIYKWFAGNQVAANATHYYACSHAAARWLFKGKSKQTLIFKNGIETEKFRYSNNTRAMIRAVLQVKSDTLVIGHVGRFSKQKNHLFLLDIFAEINKLEPNSVLLLAGDGPLKQRIEAKIEDLKLEKQVKLLGVREDIEALLQAFDLFVFPSFHEGLPVTLIEAQAAGLPCIISDVITEEVDMGIGLVKQVSLMDKVDWVRHIIQAIQHNESRTIAENALHQQGYDIRKTAEQTQTSYLSLGEKVP